MRILIFGGGGMLGHRLWMELSKQHEVWCTIHGAAHTFPALSNVNPDRIIEHVDALRIETAFNAFSVARPEVVINCIGYVKQRKEGKAALSAIDLNARFPHLLAQLAGVAGARLVHFSTDCVFSGEKGDYTEADPVDAHDIYGQTKALGEITDEPHCLTIRTSLIGRELFTRYSLVEWFLSQKGSVKGFRHAIFSGFPTVVVAEILDRYVFPNPSLSGVYHVSADPISKHDLLLLLRETYGHDIEIVPDESVTIDRSLNSRRFRSLTGFSPRSWKEMIPMMIDGTVNYEQWKS